MEVEHALQRAVAVADHERGDALFLEHLERSSCQLIGFDGSGVYESFGISPDGKQIAYSDSQTGEIKVIPVTGGEPMIHGCAGAEDSKGAAHAAWPIAVGGARGA